MIKSYKLTVNNEDRSVSLFQLDYQEIIYEVCSGESQAPLQDLILNAATRIFNDVTGIKPL